MNFKLTSPPNRRIYTVIKTRNKKNIFKGNTNSCNLPKFPARPKIRTFIILVVSLKHIAWSICTDILSYWGFQQLTSLYPRWRKRTGWEGLSAEDWCGQSVKGLLLTRNSLPSSPVFVESVISLWFPLRPEAVLYPLEKWKNIWVS